MHHPGIHTAFMMHLFFTLKCIYTQTVQNTFFTLSDLLALSRSSISHNMCPSAHLAKVCLLHLIFPSCDCLA